ncbi:tectonic-2-like [Sinocyclocheilus grahami]|uniref:tectonic-2-like n=1 Tax=Sinocyclocheilus grahami TaxID=75366 RepID=UPI0007AC7113|nr:PREDICTED: tectonic-2-like [Sinocyclocheilus grahami]
MCSSWESDATAYPLAISHDWVLSQMAHFMCIRGLGNHNGHRIHVVCLVHENVGSPKPSPSFQALQMTAPVPPINYRQGDPIFTKDDQYFTIPQLSCEQNAGLGQCAENAPVAFLENFESQCVRRLQSCPPPSDDLRVDIKDGWGGIVAVSVVDEMADDLRLFLANSREPISAKVVHMIECQIHKARDALLRSQEQ